MCEWLMSNAFLEGVLFCNVHTEVWGLGVRVWGFENSIRWHLDLQYAHIRHPGSNAGANLK